MIQLDILPTALAAAGVDVADDAQTRRRQLLPYFERQSGEHPHDALYWRFGPQMAIRQGDWKLVRYDPGGRRQEGRRDRRQALQPEGRHRRNAELDRR